MSEAFGKYAAYYDEFYKSKDYRGEVETIHRIITQFRPESSLVVDYGCGTGNHTKLLAEYGYRLQCIDLNESMLARAQAKLDGNTNVQFLHTSKQNSVEPSSVDVCVCLFDVLSYMTTNEEVNDFFTFVETILKPSGIVVFDFWYGPGVLTLKPEIRTRDLWLNGQKKLVRTATPTHDVNNSIVRVGYTVTVINGTSAVESFGEVHDMRYFFSQEIQLFLMHNRLNLLKFGTWKNLDQHPTTENWGALVIAKKKN